MLIFQLKEEVEFPNTRRVEPDGLFAVGGDLSTNRLIVAYKLGIFPWFLEGMPLLWWQPDLRMVLFPNEFKRQKSLRKIVEKSMFRVTFNQNFKKVIMYGSSVPGKGQEGTWITDLMIDAYFRLFKLGYAPSVKIWQGK